MIRLGSLAGYPFEGPRLLTGWTPPAAPAVYAILCQPDPDTGPNRYAAIYHPSCNAQQYGQSWKNEWIGEYSAPTTGPVARRDPDQSRPG
jgi:hypothetical protein